MNAPELISEKYWATLTMILGITIAHTLLLCTIEKLFKSLLRFIDAELHILEVDKDDGDRYASCVGNVAGVEAFL